MVQKNVINATTHHNAPITARPAILIPATGQANDGWVIQMGKDGPRVLDFRPAGGQSYAEWGLEPFHTVREFTGAFMRLGSPERAEMEDKISKKDRETYLGLLQLRAAHATVPFPLDEKKARTEMSSASAKLIEDPRIRATFAGGQLPQVAAWFYPAFFNRDLKRTRLVLWLTKNNQFVSAIYCPDMKTAMFAFAAFGNVAACPNCGKLFALDSERVDGSTGERYCTSACGQRYRQKVYRLKVKAKTSKSQKMRSRVAKH